ncbi:hypothetical protein GGX14DRAFT_565745 [Mycena pura]|uniref:Uncharacterized protein n=1 Tax=Mycena pura TaxID=153505 RepID=A0AAD6YBV4_9AGAR|nr:hypothetical protein GGX14DRAFT_565745 [Mycena pura]
MSRRKSNRVSAATSAALSAASSRRGRSSERRDGSPERRDTSSDSILPPRKRLRTLVISDTDGDTGPVPPSSEGDTLFAGDGDDDPAWNDDNLQNSGGTLSSTAGPSTQALPPRGAVSAFIKAHATHLKLRAEDVKKLEVFACDDPNTRQLKLYASHLLLLENLEAIKLNFGATAKDEWKASADFLTNLKGYGYGILLSPSLSAYVGKIAKTHLENIVKKKRFGIPNELEDDLSAWGKVMRAIEDVLSNQRSAIKKVICEGVEKKTELYTLTRKVVDARPKGCTFKTEVTIQLCARVALMRQIFCESPEDKAYWPAVDKSLDDIRTAAEEKADKSLTRRAMMYFIEEDRSQYTVCEDGVKVVEALEELSVGTAWQQDIDTQLDEGI